MKFKLIKDEKDFRAGKTSGVTLEQVAAYYNNLAYQVGAPEYASTNAQQLLHLRMKVSVYEPQFLGKNFFHEKGLNTTMSPMQAAHLLTLMIEQKVINPVYQTTPSQFNPRRKVGKEDLKDNPKQRELVRIILSKEKP